MTLPPPQEENRSVIAYHVTGSIMAVAFLFTVLGEYFQLRQVLKRRSGLSAGQWPGEMPTAVLSFNQIASLFLAVYAFFLFAISLKPVNHYLAWPRFLSALLAIGLLYQIKIDRQTSLAGITFWGSVGLLIVAPMGVVLGEWRNTGNLFAKGLIIAATLVLAQGYIHQIVLIRRAGRIGAVSLRFHQFVLISALSTVAFGLTMGLDQGWPLVLLASVSACLKIITLWHFRWVRFSPLARERAARSSDGMFSNFRDQQEK